MNDLATGGHTRDLRLVHRPEIGHIEHQSLAWANCIAARIFGATAAA